MALLVNIFIGDHDYDKATRLYERPPLREGLAGTAHVLEHMRTMYAVGRLSGQVACYAVRVAMPLIKRPGMRDDEIVPAPDIEHRARHEAADEVGPAKAIGFLGFKHQRTLLPISRYHTGPFIVGPPKPSRRTPSYWIARRYS